MLAKLLLERVPFTRELCVCSSASSRLHTFRRFSVTAFKGVLCFDISTSRRVVGSDKKYQCQRLLLLVVVSGQVKMDELCIALTCKYFKAFVTYFMQHLKYDVPAFNGGWGFWRC